MRIEGQRGSTNVEDRRGMSPMMKGGGLGCGGLIIVLILSYLTGFDPRALMQTADQVVPQQQSTEQAPTGTPSDQLGHFASVVLGSTEDVWDKVFSDSGKRYTPPTMVLFSGGVQSACGMTSSAVGPFYCPLDQKLYLDLSFFEEMSQRFGAPGDFAQAYVIAHEVGHHVQNLLGIAEQIQGAQERSRSQEEANQYSVAMELQADCLAGAWGNHARQAGIIEPGDFEEGLTAATAIGDDRMQRMSRGYVAPESFTHGSSAQRVEWLRKGLQSGDPNACEF